MQKYVLRNIDRPEKQLVDQFKELDVSTVYEAQGKIGLLHPSLRPIQDGQFLCGPAVTVVCQAGDNLMIHAAIEVCRPGDVLVITTIGESDSGMIGELIVTALIKRGVAGVVIDAGIRDVKQLRQLNFPVWSKAIHSQGTTKNKGGWVNASAVCAGNAIHPGDLIVADDDGIVVVRRGDVENTLEASKKRLEKEEGIREKINWGELSLDFYELRSILRQEQVVYLDDLTEQKE